MHGKRIISKARRCVNIAWGRLRGRVSRGLIRITGTRGTFGSIGLSMLELCWPVF